MGAVLLALDGGPWTGWPVLTVAGIWVVGSTLLTLRAARRRQDVGRYLGPRVAIVDIAVLALTLAATGGVDSPVRWAILAAPTFWAYAAQRRLPLLMALGALAYVGAAAPDLLGGAAGAVGTTLDFLVIYVGAVAVAVAAVASRRRESALELELVRARADMFDELVRRERRQHEDLAVRLHDGPLQMVIAAQQDLEEHLDGEDTDLRETLGTLRLAVGTLRDLNTNLYDAVLRDAGLEAALAQAAEATERNGGPRIEVSVGAATSGPHDTFVLSVVNELLTNVRKHAQATRGTVVVARTESGGLQITVSDDGVGLTADTAERAAGQGHIGLHSIRRSVEAAGGTFRLRARRPGTAVELRLPEDAAVPGNESSFTPARPPAARA